jgi:hypothetical protein
MEQIHQLSKARQKRNEEAARITRLLLDRTSKFSSDDESSDSKERQLPITAHCPIIDRCLTNEAK